MNRTAYAVGHLDTSTSPPFVAAVEIYSADTQGIATHLPDVFLFNIIAAYGDDFGDAILRLIEELKVRAPWAWAIYEAAHPTPGQEQARLHEFVACAPCDDDDKADK